MADDQDLTLSNNIYFLSNALARKLSSQADETFAKFGLSSSHALILLLVSQNPEIQPSSLAAKLYLKPSTVTRLVQKLERRQLVQRSSEGRSTLIVCTSDGFEVVNQIKEQWQILVSEVSEELGERYVEVLSEMISNALVAFNEG